MAKSRRPNDDGAPEEHDTRRRTILDVALDVVVTSDEEGLRMPRTELNSVRKV